MPCKKHLTTRRGKNLLTRDYIIKALELVEAEINILHLRIKYPQQFIKPTSDFKSPLFWSTSHKAIELSEILCGLELDGAILTSNGGPASFAMIINCFELFLNVKLGNPQDTKRAVFRRKINVTKYLDKLRHTLRKHIEEVVDR